MDPVGHIPVIFRPCFWSFLTLGSCRYIYTGGPYDRPDRQDRVETVHLLSLGYSLSAKWVLLAGPKRPHKYEDPFGIVWQSVYMETYGSCILVARSKIRGVPEIMVCRTLMFRWSCEECTDDASPSTNMTMSLGFLVGNYCYGWGKCSLFEALEPSRKQVPRLQMHLAHNLCDFPSVPDETHAITSEIRLVLLV